jgi:hypothetical protein
VNKAAHPTCWTFAPWANSRDHKIMPNLPIVQDRSFL